jgi:hypothetical protein
VRSSWSWGCGAWRSPGQGRDDHVGAADGLGGEAGVEDVRADQDLGLACGWDLRGGPVDGADRWPRWVARSTTWVPIPPEAPKTVIFMIR